MNSKNATKTRFANITMLITSLLSAVLLVCSMICAHQVNGWFIAQHTVSNPAKLTNFVTAVECSKDGGLTWVSDAEEYPFIITPDNVDDVQIRVSYRGESAAYLRVSLFGGLYNKHTGTYLPQSDAFWSFDSNATWLHADRYLYYPEKLEKKPEFSTLQPTFGIDADLESLGTISEHQQYEGKLYVIVDAVQPDRYSVHWDIPVGGLPF